MNAHNSKLNLDASRCGDSSFRILEYNFKSPQSLKGCLLTAISIFILRYFLLNKHNKDIKLF